MRTSTVGALIFLGLILAIFVVALRNRRAGKDLMNYLREAGFAAARCPIEKPFTYTDMTLVTCYRGELRPGLAAYVLLANRPGTAVMINGAAMPTQEYYLGLYLPQGIQVTDAWLADWRADLDARGAKPMRVVRTAEGGLLFNWRSPHDKSTLEDRLSAVRKALPG